MFKQKQELKIIEDDSINLQALAAASKTVDCLKLVHSLHVYFLLVGDFDSEYIINKLSYYNLDF